jgi:hypothetical protein
MLSIGLQDGAVRDFRLFACIFDAPAADLTD